MLLQHALLDIALGVATLEPGSLASSHLGLGLPMPSETQNRRSREKISSKITAESIDQRTGVQSEDEPTMTLDNTNIIITTLVHPSRGEIHQDTTSPTKCDLKF